MNDMDGVWLPYIFSILIVFFKFYMEGWEDEMYDYGGGDLEYEEEFPVNYRESDDGDEYNPFEGGEAADDELDFKPDFKQMQQMTGDKGRGSDQFAGKGDKSKKSMRSAEDVIKDQVRGILSSENYSEITEPKKNYIVEKIESVKNSFLLNTELLVQAVIWTVEKRSLDKKTFGEYIKKYKVKDHITLLLYIRMLTIGKK